MNTLLGQTLPVTIKINKIAVCIEESWLDTGMVVDIINVTRHADYDDDFYGNCYQVRVDGAKYYRHNLKRMTECYYPNIHTPKDGRELFNAIEAGMYSDTEDFYLYVAKSETSVSEALSNAILSFAEKTPAPDSEPTDTLPESTMETLRQYLEMRASQHGDKEAGALLGKLNMLTNTPA